MKLRYYLKEFLHKAFSPFFRNSTLLPEDYLQPVLKAGSSHCYVENTGNKADSLHRRIKQTYEEDLLKAYRQVLVPLLKYKRITFPTLAIDFTDEDFYGYHTDVYVHPWTGEEGVEGHWRFAVLSLVKEHKIPLLAVPVHRGMDKADLVKQFLAFARKLFGRIRCVLMDAGFYSGAVMEVLQSEKYIIRAPQNEKVKKFIAATPEYDWKRWDHTVEWNGNRTTNRTSTAIVVVRNVKMKKGTADCCYATNMALDAGMEYVHLYCRRWQIETNFRVQDHVHVMSKSLEMIIRYFYFMISLLLHALWLLFWSRKIAFDTFKVRAAEQLLLESYGIPYAYSVL